MAVRSKRLAGPTIFSAAATAGRFLLYTCPAGETALVKTVTVNNQSGAAATWVLELEPVGGVGAAPIATGPAAHTDVIVIEHWYVMLPGDKLHLNVTTRRDLWVVGVFGTELEGLAD